MPTIALFLSFVVTASPYTFFEEYNPVQCGDTVTESGGFQLQAGVTCEFKVEVPDGKTFSLALVDDLQSACKKITVIDELQQTKSSLCTTMSFSGSSKYFSIRVKNLLEPVNVQINFQQTVFGCGEIVRRERSLHPFSFKVNKKVRDCILAIPTSDILHIASAAPAREECLSGRIEVAQGTHIDQMTKSTGDICLGPSPIEVEIVCGVALVYLNAPVGTTVTISTRPSKPSLYRRFTECRL